MQNIDFSDRSIVKTVKQSLIFCLSTDPFMVSAQSEVKLAQSLL